jgi:hypothetical protein
MKLIGYIALACSLLFTLVYFEGTFTEKTTRLRVACFIMSLAQLAVVYFVLVGIRILK